MSCKLHSVSVVHLDDDLAQFELCDRDAQLHFYSTYLSMISVETCAGTINPTKILKTDFSHIVFIISHQEIGTGII